MIGGQVDACPLFFVSVPYLFIDAKSQSRVNLYEQESEVVVKWQQIKKSLYARPNPESRICVPVYAGSRWLNRVAGLQLD